MFRQTHIQPWRNRSQSSGMFFRVFAGFSFLHVQMIAKLQLPTATPKPIQLCVFSCSMMFSPGIQVSEVFPASTFGQSIEKECSMLFGVVWIARDESSSTKYSDDLFKTLWMLIERKRMMIHNVCDHFCLRLVRLSSRSHTHIYIYIYICTSEIFVVRLDWLL